MENLNLKQLREQKGLSINELSKKTGLSRECIRRCEKGEKVSFNKFKIYLNALGLSFRIVDKFSYLTYFEHDGEKVIKIIFDLLNGFKIIINFLTEKAAAYKNNEFYNELNYNDLMNIDNLVYYLFYYLNFYK